MRQNADFIHSTCFGHQYAHHQEYKLGSCLFCVALAVGCVYCLEDVAHLPSSTHIQQRALHITGSFQVCTPDDGHTGARNMLSEQYRHFVTSGWSLSYIISTMHGHTNIKSVVENVVLSCRGPPRGVVSFAES